MQPSQRGNEQRLELAESLSTFGYDVRRWPEMTARLLTFLHTCCAPMLCHVCTHAVHGGNMAEFCSQHRQLSYTPGKQAQKLSLDLR